ncbi:MAG TPA: tetratricopeptide repeat protein, partial [Polyangia bacterium]|nr:tetratricopeptide repeat protein [Polyangia bacterium]
VENAIAYLYEKGGMAALREAIKRVGDGEDARQAVAAAAGGSWPEFEKGWRAFMLAQHYKTFPAIDIATTHIRKANAIASGRKPAEEDALSSTLKGSPPYRFLRLGNMLLARERPRAAAAEYEKGAKAIGTGARGDPSSVWLFPVKLGRTYLALGEPDKALKAVGTVQTIYPDLPWPHLIAGQAHLAMGDAAGAVDLLRASIAENPFDPRVHCALADAYGRVKGSSAELIQREQRFCKDLNSGD